jgi:diguanylate cyclase (GGDEF)-like protein/PAS domain S-box-containing protein
MGLLDLAPIARDLLVESARDGMLALDTRRRLVDFNPAAQRLLSLPADALGQPLEQALAAQPQALAALQSADPEAEVRLEGDPPRHLSLQLTGLHSARGQPLGQLVTLSEITARRQMEDALRESEARYRSLIEQAPLPIAVLDIEGEHVLYANPRFAALFDTTPQNALQLHLPALYEDPADRLRLLAQLSRSGHVNGFEVCHKTLSGWHFWALVSAIQTTWCGMPAHLVFYFDITARRQLQHALEQKTRQLERLAITDGLTGLYNRRYADQVLEREFARAARYRRPLCLALLDLDNLKEINARCGHAGGDQALQSLARLLQDHTRVSDTAARIGGDEFLIILPHIGLEKACQAVERLRSALAGTPPIQDGGPALSVSAGIVAWHAGENPAQALLRADRLLYQAKEAGRNQVRHETPEAAPEPAAHPEAG